jgi:hypothetical protein
MFLRYIFALSYNSHLILTLSQIKYYTDATHPARDSSVGIGAGYWLEGPVSIAGSVQTGSGANPASYSMGTTGAFLGGKAARE